MGGSARRFTTTGGSVVHLEATGDGPAVLALHGVGGGAYFFQGFASRLSDAYAVTALDLPGTGRSQPSPLPTLDSWVADIADVITRDIARPVVIVGHSLGTILALKVWHQLPEQVRGLVFIGGLPTPREPVRQRLRERAAAIRDQGMAGWGARITPGIFGSQAFADQPETIALFERVLDAIDVPSYLRSLELLVTADATTVVPEVAAPCFSISGAEDQYAPPEAVAAFVQQLGRETSSVTLPGIGHMPFFEAPAALADLVRGFLKTVPGWAPERR